MPDGAAPGQLRGAEVGGVRCDEPSGEYIVRVRIGGDPFADAV